MARWATFSAGEQKFSEEKFLKNFTVDAWVGDFAIFRSQKFSRKFSRSRKLAKIGRQSAKIFRARAKELRNYECPSLFDRSKGIIYSKY